MKTYSILFNGSIHYPTGVLRVVESHIKNIIYMEERGYKFNKLYSLDGICSYNDYIIRCKSNINNKVKKSRENVLIQINNKTKLIIKNIIKSFVWNTKIGQYIYFNYSILSKPKKLVSLYVKNQNDSDDVVFIHDVFTAFFLIKSGVKQKYILVMHNNGATISMLDIYYKKILKNKFREKIINIEKEAINRAEKVIFVSKNSLDYSTRYFDLKDIDKYSFIYNGVEDKVRKKVNKKYNKKNELNLLCVGSLSYRKGQDIIIKAYSELSDEIKNRFKITFIGKGPNFEEFVELSKKLGVDSRITFKGMKKNVEKYLDCSDLLLLISRDEGLPISIIEGLMYGLPVITTPVGGIPELIENGYNGFIVNPEVNEVKDLLTSLSANVDLLNKMSINARNSYLEKFTINHMMERYCEEIRKINI